MGGDSELKPDMESKKKKKGKRAIAVNIEMVRDQPDKISPLVGYFPSGYDPSKRKKARSDPPSVKVYRSSSKPNRLELVVSPSNPSTVDFVGQTHGLGEASAHKMCSYALGVLDKETQTLKIVPIASDKVFRLDPVVRGLDVSDKTPATNSTPAQIAKNIRELTNTYGTTRAKKGIQRVMNLRITEDPAARPELEKELEEAIDKDALASTSAETTRNIPPHNLSANAPEAVYPLDKIIFTGDWDYLYDIWDLFKEKAELKPTSYSSFVCSRSYKLDLIKDESEQKKLACVLSFLNHLIKFKDRFTMSGNSSAKKHQIPSILYQRFSSMFIDSEKNRLSDDKIGLLVSYIVVLTLIVDNFQTIPEDIAKDLKMTKQTVKVYYENVGCKFTRISNKSIATLSVPLQFKVQRKRRS